MTSCDSILSAAKKAMSTKTYRQLLAAIDSELHEDNIKSLKFLCEPNLGMKKTSSNFSTGIEIFDALEKKSKLSKDRLFYLCELLHIIGRVDLAMTVDPEVSSSCTQPRHVDPFRVMLFNLSQQLASEDLSRLRYLYGKVPKRATINDGIDLFSMMLQQNTISPMKLNLLRELFLEIDRHDLIEEITSFCDGSLSGHQELNSSHYIEVTPVLESTNSGNGDISDYNALELEISDQDEPMENHTLESISDNESLKNEDSIAYFQLSSLKIQNKKVDDMDNIPVSMEPAQVVTPLDIPYEVHAGSAINGMLEDESYIPLEYYKMDADPRGICIVIDNQTFEADPYDPEAVQTLGNRDGSDKDSEKLLKTFHRLKFIVDVKKNLKDTEMIQLLKDISAGDHTHYDCFVCCILSHGGENHVFGVNGRKIQLGDITTMFRAQSCPSLARKPKLFFLASCRGKDHQVGVEDMASEPIDTDMPQIDFDTSMWIPNESDFLLGYSTVLNYVSYRSKSQGTFYIEALTSVLDKYAHREDLQTLLLRVNDEVSNRIYHRKEPSGVHMVYKQTPAPQHTLRKHLKFL